MNFLVAVVADRQRFAPFCYHHLLPRLFSFQIFHLVHKAVTRKALRNKEGEEWQRAS